MCEENDEFPEGNKDEQSISTQANLNSIANKWSTFINKLDSDLRKDLRDDPGGFSSAVKRTYYYHL